MNIIAESTSKKQHLSCFAYTLHLLIGGSVKETKCIASAIAKCSPLPTALHNSTKFRDAFESCFGKEKSIPAAVSTRWNSTLRQVKAIISLPLEELNTVLEEESRRNLTISTCKYSQLSELCEILQLFGETTDETQGDKDMTVSCVLPCILYLNNHLREMKTKLKYCLPLVKALEKSPLKCFEFVFQRCQMAAGESKASNKFEHDIFFITAILSPRFRFYWLDNDVWHHQV